MKDKQEEIRLDIPIFGPDAYSLNVAKIRSARTLSGRKFRECTTVESMIISALDFIKVIKPKIFDLSSLQIGRIVKMPEGIVANPPMNNRGDTILKRDKIKNFIDSARKIKIGKGNIYLGENDFGFAEYETFQHDAQDCKTFLEGGLARILEHSAQSAQPFKVIANSKIYKRGMDVYSFHPANKIVEQVVCLKSRGYLADVLLVSCNDLDDYSYDIDYDNTGIALGLTL